MAVKWKTVSNKIPEVDRRMTGLKGKKVQIGALNGSHAYLAGIHEYGCEIPVTEKMRKWFIAQGFPLKETTTVIKIPERAFLRNGHDQNADRIIAQTERMISLVVAGKMSDDRLLTECGRQFATAIKEYMSQTQKNSSMTVAMKGSSTPLTATGGLVDSIDFKIEG